MSKKSTFDMPLNYIIYINYTIINKQIDDAKKKDQIDRERKTKSIAKKKDQIQL